MAVEIAVITPVSFEPPQEGVRKKWKIISEDGEAFSCHPRLRVQFHEGKTCKVSYETFEFNGKIYKDIKGVVQATNAAPPQATNSPRPANVAPQQKTTWQPQQRSLQEQAIIAACGIVNHAVAAGIVVLDEDSITEAFNASLNGFYNSKAALPYHGQVPKAQPPAQTATKKPTAGEEMDDQIPF